MKFPLIKSVSCAAVLSLVGIIAACGGAQSDKSASGSGTQKEVTLKFLDWNTQFPEEVHAEMQKAVAKSLPHVKLEFENIVWANFQSLLQTKIAARELPDIIHFKASDIPLYAKAGHLMDLSSMEFMKQFTDDVRNNLKVDNKDYAVPYTSNVQGVFYNKKIFQENSIEPPKSWDELMQVAQKLKSKGITPFTAHFKDTQVGNNTMQFAMLDVFSKNPQWGVDLQNGKVSFATSPEYKTVFEHIKQIYPLTNEDPFGVDLAGAAEIFANGKTAMFITGTWAPTQVLKNNPNLEIGYFPTPAVDEKNTKVIIQSDHSFSGSATTKHPEEVKKVLEILATDKTLAKFYADKLKTFSLLTDVSPEIKNQYADDIAKYRKNGIIDVNIGNVQIPWAYQVEYSKYIAEWIFGQKTIENALKAADDFKSKVKF
ncbi:ABC transporter substrate-binding protein [Paenibacillus piri]|uniref:Carbohydrate ABC transporter substrate-binding protein n=1 Tax=Paenibacillus piri TaxID=2547395 RepID=A0A4R5KNP4_9BACL|nr:ABC transporter substrate-binding protein [Paenibacillus piri]TDF97186.1 carbohydrate ABC transporter substrate-binding protein [Paenibacillus piri]